MKQGRDISDWPHVCKVFLIFLTFILTPADYLSCDCIIYPILCLYRRRVEQRNEQQFMVLSSVIEIQRNCLENQFTLHGLCDENHKRQV
jgi:hypothetical protein